MAKTKIKKTKGFWLFITLGIIFILGGLVLAPFWGKVWEGVDPSVPFLQRRPFQRYDLGEDQPHRAGGGADRSEEQLRRGHSLCPEGH